MILKSLSGKTGILRVGSEGYIEARENVKNSKESATTTNDMDAKQKVEKCVVEQQMWIVSRCLLLLNI